MRIRLCQCLCPQRHAIFALGVFDPTVTDDIVKDALRLLIEDAISEDVTGDACGVCAAPISLWTYEIGWSREFADEAEARAELERLERANLDTRLILEALNHTPARARVN